MASTEKTFWVRSLYGANTREPIVAITMPGGEMVQVRPDDARALAVNLLQAAEAAETDAFVFEFLQRAIDATEHEAAGVLNEFRQWRQRRRGEQT